jgi:uncharacterized protein (DUF58 family)
VGFAALRLRMAERIGRWARKRQGEDVTPLVLRARRLYILPTSAGYTSALLLLVMLIAGLNYGNSLALLLTFLLAGFVLVGMYECQRTLRGLELLRARAEDCHAGSDGALELRLGNSGRHARRSLRVGSASGPATAFEIAPGVQLNVSLLHRCAHRGRHRIGRLELTSTAPFGLFRCWTWLHLPLEVIVYPRPAGSRPLPRALAGRAATLTPNPAHGEDEWASLRAYQLGDSPRSIAWKTVARGGPFMVGQYAGAAGQDYRLSFAGLESLDLEARLSQLCVWVEECARIGAACALSLPGIEIPPARGASHRQTLLRALALYGSGAP